MSSNPPEVNIYFLQNGSELKQVLEHLSLKMKKVKIDQGPNL